jgi:adenylate kinase
VEGRCDLCGSELYQRKDDNPEIIEKRLSSYEAETGLPLTQFYSAYKSGKFIELDAELSPDEVYKSITQSLAQAVV